MRRHLAAVLVTPLITCLPATALASTIFITGGNLNGQTLSASDWVVNAAPGESIAGTISVQVTTTGSSSSVVFPLGYTWTWGPRETSFVSMSADAPFGVSNWNVPINLTAPATQGNHHVLFGVRGEFTLAQVFSATNQPLAPVWNDGNDYHDMTSADILEAHQNGFVKDWFVLGQGPNASGDAVAVGPLLISVVPELPTAFLFSLGLAGFALFRRR